MTNKTLVTELSVTTFVKGAVVAHAARCLPFSDAQLVG